MKLHCFGESGHSYKAALALELSKTPWEPVFIDFFKGETRSAEFRALNIMGEAPVLEDGDIVLTQSGVILDYISSKTGMFGGKSAAERREVLRWIMFDAHKLSGVAGALRFNMNFLPEEKRNEAVNNYLASRFASALAVIDTQLKETPFLIGDAMTIADFACCGYLFYPEPFTFERSKYQHISAWLDRVSETPGWKHPYELMPGNPSDRTS